MTGPNKIRTVGELFDDYARLQVELKSAWANKMPEVVEVSDEEAA